MLEISNLNKSFKNNQVLNNVSLKVEENEIMGFVGPNGAGKTTLMRIASGLILPDSGNVVLDGYDVFKDTKKVRRSMGYMPDYFGAYNNLKTKEYMEFYSSLYGIKGMDAKKRCDELLDLVNLLDKKDTYVDVLSRGQKQRLCLARCLIHDPKMLFLDEPASGLDPRARVEMKMIMKTLKDMGKTVIISSHILPELEEMATTICIIQKGNIIVKGTKEEIINSLNKGARISIKLVNIEDCQRVIECVKKDDNVDKITIDENVVSFVYNGDEEELASLNTLLFSLNIKISNISSDKGSLEELFMELSKNDEEEGV